MGMINSIRSYILEDEFKLTFKNNKVDIINYDSVMHVSSNMIKIKFNDGILIISGTNLIISKLVNDELLVSGLISNIEIR